MGSNIEAAAAALADRIVNQLQESGVGNSGVVELEERNREESDSFPSELSEPGPVPLSCNPCYFECGCYQTTCVCHGSTYNPC